MLIYYIIHLDIVSSFMIFNNLYLGSIDKQNFFPYKKFRVYFFCNLKRGVLN